MHIYRAGRDPAYALVYVGRGRQSHSKHLPVYLPVNGMAVAPATVYLVVIVMGFRGIGATTCI